MNFLKNFFCFSELKMPFPIGKGIGLDKNTNVARAMRARQVSSRHAANTHAEAAKPKEINSIARWVQRHAAQRHPPFQPQVVTSS